MQILSFSALKKFNKKVYSGEKHPLKRSFLTSEPHKNNSFSAKSI